MYVYIDAYAYVDMYTCVDTLPHSSQGAASTHKSLYDYICIYIHTDMYMYI